MRFGLRVGYTIVPTLLHNPQLDIPPSRPRFSRRESRAVSTEYPARCGV